MAKKSSKKTGTGSKTRTRAKSHSEQEDLIELILADHEKIRPLLKIIKDTRAHMEDRWDAFERFAPLLELHSQPEEYTLYDTMKENKKLREIGFEGEVEHVLAEQMAEEAKREKDKDRLSAKLKVLAELVEQHMEEEERMFLPQFNKMVDARERQDLGRRFLRLKDSTRKSLKAESNESENWAHPA